MNALFNPLELESAFRRILARCTPATVPAIPPAVQAARNALRSKGWKHSEAAAQIGVTPVHLSYVLTGRRTSRRILEAINHLPPNPNPA